MKNCAKVTLEAGHIGPELFMKTSKKILIVDDSELFIELERQTLEQLDGVEILTATSALEALRTVRAEKPDLVFLDFYMNGMNGDECCRIIKKECNTLDIPVIMVTNTGREEDYLDCWDAGCDAIVLKPFNSSLLTSMAKNFLNLSERSERHTVANLEIHYGTNQQTKLTDYCINLSLGGLFLSTSNILPVDTELLVEFTLPSRKDPISCRAKVAWCNNSMVKSNQNLPTGMGLRFIDLNLEDLSLIRDYLSAGKLKPS